MSTGVHLFYQVLERVVFADHVADLVVSAQIPENRRRMLNGRARVIEKVALSIVRADKMQ